LDVMDKVVVDDWREAQSGRFGALRRHVDSGRLSAASLYAELGQIVTGRLPGRERGDERILFWHRGLAILDLAVGLAILRRAEQQGDGSVLRDRHGCILFAPATPTEVFFYARGAQITHEDILLDGLDF